MATLSDLGVSVDLPGGWDGRIFGREIAGARRAAVHAATFPLPGERGDFGAGAVELMSSDDVFVVLLEYDPADAERPLFQAHGQPAALDRGSFSSTVLQRSIGGQAGSQSFFTAAGRAFCLYVVIGAFANRDRLVAQANRVLGSIHIEG